MARKTKITPEEETKAQRIIDNMTPEELKMMDAFEKEYDKLPEEIQDALFVFVQHLSKMPDKQREDVLNRFDLLASFLDNDDEDEYEDEIDEELDREEYNHYLPKANVQKYTLRVTIKDHKPSIYRKFCVPSNISLRHLSELLIDLMGWNGGHLNQFRKGNNYYAPAYQREGEMPVMFGPAKNFNQEDFALSDILNDKGKSIEWEYDFGDSWLHEVRLSSISEYKKGEAPVSFVKGECACPPEDCGGIWGYEDLLDIYVKFQKYTTHFGKRPSSDELDRLEWYGMSGNFDPSYFDETEARKIYKDFCD